MSVMKTAQRSNKQPTTEVGSDLDSKRIGLAQFRLTARMWADSLAEDIRQDFAALFARTAVSAFAAEKASGLTLRQPFVATRGRLESTSRKLATLIGKEAAALPTLEACHFLTGLYTALLPTQKRSKLGAFYTPPALTRRLVDLAEEGGVDWSTARVLDPSSGGGAFLLEVASRMCRALQGRTPRTILAHIGTQLTGFEIDPHAASLSQYALDILLYDLSVASGSSLPLVVQVCDTLEEAPFPHFDLVVGNPPYGRVNLTASQRNRYARSLYGHANLYGVFTDAAIRWTRPGGLIAYLTPTSVLGGQYYAALRHLLATEAPPSSIDFVHARRGVFEDVLQETLLALYGKGHNNATFQVHYLHLENERETRLVRNGKVGLPKNGGAPWLAPREPDHVGLIKATEGMPTRLSDLGYYVSTGPLVWNRFKEQMRDRTGNDVFPLIWAEAVTPDGSFIFRAEKRSHTPYFKMQSGDSWLLVDQECVLVQRTTAKEQARRLIAAILPQSFINLHGGAVIENHLNMVRSKAPKVTPATVAAILNSDIVDQVFRCISGSVAVSAFELESIPLPSAKALAPIEHLVSKRAPRASIEQALRVLYGFKK